MHHRHALTCVVLLMLAGNARAAAQVVNDDEDDTAFPITLSFDRYRTIDTGAHLTFAAATALANLETRASSGLKGNRRVGIPVRIARTVFVDHPVGLFLAVMQHEAYGHGGRAREFGSGSRYSLGSPWKIDTLFKGRTRFGGGATFDVTGFSLDDLIGVYTGGVEANARSATHIVRELVAGRKIQPLQLFYLIRSRSYAGYYVLVNTPDPVSQPLRFYQEWSGGGDVARYLGYLNTKYCGEAGITPQGSSATVLTEYRRLRRQAWLNVLEPGTWLSLWSVARQVVTGEEPAPLALPRLRGRRVLPIVTADWMPDGGAISVETVFSRTRDQAAGPRWFSLLVREGNGPGGRLWSVGAATESFTSWRNIRMGGEAQLWNQPSSGAGAGATIRFVVTKGRPRGLLGEVGFKSDGHWPGRPAASGVFSRIGYQFNPR